MAVTFDTRKAVKKLRNKGGFTEAAADATVDVVTDATSPLVTREDLTLRAPARTHLVYRLPHRNCRRRPDGRGTPEVARLYRA